MKPQNWHQATAAILSLLLIPFSVALAQDVTSNVTTVSGAFTGSACGNTSGTAASNMVILN